MFCPQCGTKNEEGARFCLKCGAALVLSAPAPSTGQRSKLFPFGGIIIAAIIMIMAIALWASFREAGVAADCREDCRKVIENWLARGNLENTVRVISLKELFL